MLLALVGAAGKAPDSGVALVVVGKGLGVGLLKRDVLTIDYCIGRLLQLTTIGADLALLGAIVVPPSRLHLKLSPVLFTQVLPRVGFLVRFVAVLLAFKLHEQIELVVAGHVLEAIRRVIIITAAPGQILGPVMALGFQLLVECEAHVAVFKFKLRVAQVFVIEGVLVLRTDGLLCWLKVTVPAR